MMVLIFKLKAQYTIMRPTVWETMASRCPSVANFSLWVICCWVIISLHLATDSPLNL